VLSPSLDLRHSTLTDLILTTTQLKLTPACSCSPLFPRLAASRLRLFPDPYDYSSTTREGPLAVFSLDQLWKLRCRTLKTHQKHFHLYTNNMPPIRSMPAAKPVKTERSHEENQERSVDAYLCMPVITY
jgi:hypothetical protein